MNPIHILLAEDTPGDVRITQEALRNDTVAITLHVVSNGVEAMGFLRKQPPFTDAVTPDLILLDLNMPVKNGHEVLAEVKQDPRLRTIPVVILTTSDAERDVSSTFARHANSYITKPVNLDQFFDVIMSIYNFSVTANKPLVRK